MVKTCRKAVRNTRTGPTKSLRTIITIISIRSTRSDSTRVPIIRWKKKVKTRNRLGRSLCRHDGPTAKSTWSRVCDGVRPKALCYNVVRPGENAVLIHTEWYRIGQNHTHSLETTRREFSWLFPLQLLVVFPTGLPRVVPPPGRMCAALLLLNQSATIYINPVPVA